MFTFLHIVFTLAVCGANWDVNSGGGNPAVKIIIINQSKLIKLTMFGIITRINLEIKNI